MTWCFKMRLVGFITLLSIIIQVSGYCQPGTDSTIEVIQPVGNKKASVPVGGTTTLEVRYKGSPAVKWHLNGKEIPKNVKSPHFEFVKGGPGLNHIGPILKIKDFKKDFAGQYKITINKDGCVNSKTMIVALDTTFNVQNYIDLIFKKVPYLKTKVGISLFLAGLAFVFIVIPLIICGSLCTRIRKLKKELRTEKAKIDSYFAHEMKKKSKEVKRKKSHSHKEKSSKKEREALLEASSSSSDLPSARHKKK